MSRQKNLVALSFVSSRDVGAWGLVWRSALLFWVTIFSKAILLTLGISDAPINPIWYMGVPVVAVTGTIIFTRRPR